MSYKNYLKNLLKEDEGNVDFIKQVGADRDMKQILDIYREKLINYFEKYGIEVDDIIVEDGIMNTNAYIILPVSVKTMDGEITIDTANRIKSELESNEYIYDVNVSIYKNQITITFNDIDYIELY